MSPFVLCLLFSTTIVVALALQPSATIIPTMLPLNPTTGIKHFSEILQTTCFSSSGDLKIATGKGDYIIPSPGGCSSSWPSYFAQTGWSSTFTITSYNPTGDDTYEVNAYYIPNCYFASDGCHLGGPSSCNFAPNAPCTPPAKTKNSYTDFFNVTACGSNSAPMVMFGCLETPGLFNDHCEIHYEIEYCGITFVNTTNSFPTQCNKN